MSYKITFDNPVYSDAGLTTLEEGPFQVTASTKLPKGIHFTPSPQQYVGTAVNQVDDVLYTVTFTTDHIINGDTVTINSGAQFT
jgi:hypothetical protein